MLKQRVFIIFLMLFCVSCSDDEFLSRIDRDYLRSNLSENEIKANFQHIFNEYGDIHELYRLILNDKEYFNRIVINQQARSDLGAYFLNICIGLNSIESNSDCRRMIDAGFNPLIRDFRGVYPISNSLVVGNKPLYEYIIKETDENLTEFQKKMLVDLNKFLQKCGIECNTTKSM